jgi:RND family efflux transporter MFP subunit
MHPTYVSKRAGDCPICNMKLVPIQDDHAAAKPSAPAATNSTPLAKPGQFYCPMHPTVISNVPGICPDCDMKLVKAAPPAPNPDREATPSSPTPPPGRVRVHVPADKRQLIGLTLSTVEKRHLTRTLRTTARVEHDETRYTRIAPRFAGWVRKLHVNFTGAPVDQGQPLLSVYSPELYSTENDYLIAWRAARHLPPDAPAAQESATQALLDSARLRLDLFEVSEPEIRELERRGTPAAELLLRAPFSGHVLTKNAIDGKAFTAGETLYELGDLSHLWLRAAAYELDWPLIRLGQTTHVSFPYLTMEPITAPVSFLYPHIDPLTRRGEFRVEIDNPGHRLRPDMWANVDLDIDLGQKLAVPASALIDTGQRFIAFVQTPDDYLEPRDVHVGARTENEVEVLSGLSDNERVVTRALFLIDAESQLKAAVTAMNESTP